MTKLSIQKNALILCSFGFLLVLSFFIGRVIFPFYPHEDDMEFSASWLRGTHDIKVLRIVTATYDIMSTTFDHSNLDGVEVFRNFHIDDSTGGAWLAVEGIEKNTGTKWSYDITRENKFIEE